VSVQQRKVNFSNILRAAFAPIFFPKKMTKPNRKHRKAYQNTFVQKGAFKKLVKLTP
jgi:hypothetical protein